MNAVCFYKYKHVCSHVYFFLCYLFLRIFAATVFLSSHWLQTWNNVFDQFFTQIAIRKYLNYDLPFLPFSDPSRFPTSGPRARRHKFKTNTYTHNIRSKFDEMIQSPFRLLQTRIKNRMAFTQIEWILAIRNQSLAICVPQDVCTSHISRHVQNKNILIMNIRHRPSKNRSRHASQYVGEEMRSDRRLTLILGPAECAKRFK